MEKLSYYYNILYEEDFNSVEKYESKWLNDNYQSYSHIRENYKKVCIILSSLVTVGIPISIIIQQKNFIYLYTVLAILTAMVIKISNKIKEQKYINKYFAKKDEILSRIEENEFYNIECTGNNNDDNNNYKNDIDYVIDSFIKTTRKYYKKYEVPFFMSKSQREYKMLFEYLKAAIDSKKIKEFDNYYDLFLDLLNRTYAKCLYNDKTVEVTDYVDEIFNYESIDEDFIEKTKAFRNRLNITDNKFANIYNVEGLRRK